MLVVKAKCVVSIIQTHATYSGPLVSLDEPFRPSEGVSGVLVRDEGPEDVDWGWRLGVTMFIIDDKRRSFD